mgnify:CR=1 FL=1
MLSEPLLGLRGKTNSTDSAFSAASKSEDTNFAAALMQAEMKQIEYMTSEISISHKRFAFNKMVAQMESLSGESGRKDNGRISPTSEDRLKKTKRLLQNDIPRILSDLRKSIIENELLIQELRYNIGYGESEGVWGRQTVLVRNNGDGDSFFRDSSRGSSNRRSTWHGRDSSTAATGKMGSTGSWGRDTGDTALSVSSNDDSPTLIPINTINTENKSAARRLSDFGLSGYQERVRSYTVATSQR